jgi:hypothetical protein
MPATVRHFANYVAIFFGVTAAVAATILLALQN